MRKVKKIRIRKVDTASHMKTSYMILKELNKQFLLKLTIYYAIIQTCQWDGALEQEIRISPDKCEK